MNKENKIKYKTGEFPEYGDIVRGIPNSGTKPVFGINVAYLDGAMSIIYVKRDGSGDTVRVYGDVSKFELIGRNEV